MANKGWPKKSKSKYLANKVTIVGNTYDSKYEGQRALYLTDLQKCNKITGLRRQVKFVLISQTSHMVPVQLKTKVKYVKRVVENEATYHCDFLYKENGKYVIEEFKSVMTAKLPDYILRRKLMIKKIYEHNAKGRSQWIFREAVYSGKKITIEDK